MAIVIYYCVASVNYVVVDSKGLGKEKSRILSVLEQVGIEVVRI